MQTRLETLHNKWTCKLQIYVTDMTAQSEQSAGELAQIEKLLASMQTIGLKQAELLQHRQQLLQDNFESAEKSELTTHLQTQIQDCDQMIEDTQEQIAQIKVQVDKIVKAHDDRKEVIKDQIAELNIIRSQKVDLDKQISLQSSQIMDLNRHI
jgi:chromosome segregation ATPase